MKMQNGNSANGVVSRREVLRGGMLALAGSAVAHQGWAARTGTPAAPKPLPLGLQLFSVHDQMKADFEGTLRQIGALGYREVEAAGFYGRTPAQVKAAMQAAGLRCVSAHSSATDLDAASNGVPGGNLGAILDFNHQAGVENLVCSFPLFRNPARVEGLSYNEQIKAFTPDDLLYSAERFNQWGQQVQAAGMRFSYHNHTMEFAPGRGGETSFDTMVRLTDPALVNFELDCGWAIVGGGDPVALLQRYPTRFTMLHVKDFKKIDHPYTVTDSPPAAELGQGIVDLPAILRAAQKTAVRHCFVEQEDYDEPPFQALAADLAFMRSFRG